MRHAFIVDIAEDSRAIRDLSAGGVFVTNAEAELDDECNLILRAGATELRVVARVVLVTQEGAGLEIVAMTNETRQRIAELVEIARHLDLVPAKTLTAELASRGLRRKPDASLPPGTQRSGGRMASGSIAPPSQRDAKRNPDDEND